MAKQRLTKPGRLTRPGQLNQHGAPESFTTNNGLKVSGSNWTSGETAAFNSSVIRPSSQMARSSAPGRLVGPRHTPMGSNNQVSGDGRLLNSAIDTIKRMPTGPGGFKGAEGAQRSQTRQIRQAMMLSKLMGGAAETKDRISGQLANTRLVGQNQLANTELSGQNQLANTELAGKNRLASDRQQGKNRLANTRLIGQNQLNLAGVQNKNTLERLGVENQYNRESANRDLQGRLLLAGATGGGALDNLGNAPGYADRDTSGIQIPGRESNPYQAKTVGEYDNMGNKVGERLIGFNQQTGQMVDAGQPLTGSSGSPVDIASRFEAGQLDLNNLSPDDEAAVVSLARTNPTLYQQMVMQAKGSRQ